MPSKTVDRQGGPSTMISPKRGPPPATLQRLRSGGDAASTLESSAVAAMGSVRTLASMSSSGTSLHPIAPRRAIKVVLIGDGGCGKTSMRNRFLTNTFFPCYRATIGADFITKTLPLDPANPEGEKVTLQIWDTAGQERFQSLGSAFYRGADAVIIAFDATNGEQGLKRVKLWYDAFMQKAPGPGEEGERRRFCWVCAANKSDLVDQGTEAVARETTWAVLDELVPRQEGQVDWGIDPGQQGTRSSGAEEPANPAEVLSRPDPNQTETSQPETNPSRSTLATAGGAREGGLMPISLKKLGNSHSGDASPTSKRKSNYRLSRKSLSSIAAAAAKSVQQAESSSDADEPRLQANATGGTVNTLYTTPYNTMSNLALSTSPTETDTTPKQDEDKSTTSNSGFLSSWIKTKSKSTASQPNGKGHSKRQSIKSIEVFQISDAELDSDASETAGDARFAFPSSSKSASVQQTPPRSVQIGGAVSMKDRQRVDSTMSLNAPSVYHTPRSSTFFSASPTRRTTLGVPNASASTSRDDGSIRRGQNQSTYSSLAVPQDELSDNSAKLKHKPSIASSSLSVATIKPNHPISHSNSMLRAPQSINDLFQPSSPPPPPKSPSSISLPLGPVPPPTTAPADIEHGFTLFNTSAKTGHNIDRMFAHIVHRTVASQQYTAAVEAATESEDQRQERQQRESELIRRTIRLASGKNPDKSRFGCCST